jgi:hypothetical protein
VQARRRQGWVPFRNVPFAIGYSSRHMVGDIKGEVNVGSSIGLKAFMGSVNLNYHDKSVTVCILKMIFNIIIGTTLRQ